jgi:hypothetical protein
MGTGCRVYGMLLTSNCLVCLFIADRSCVYDMLVHNYRFACDMAFWLIGVSTPIKKNKF